MRVRINFLRMLPRSTTTVRIDVTTRPREMIPTIAYGMTSALPRFVFGTTTTQLEFESYRI